jgi:phosphoribosyl 1,2-cyclic phosphate phosphodiesterase
VCASGDPRDSRYRASAYIELDSGESILIDAGPECRLQALRAGISRVSALLVTHCHADHLHGLDDLRVFSGSRPMPLYASPGSCREIRDRFPYIFAGRAEGGGIPSFDLIQVGARPGECFEAAGTRVMPIPISHGSSRILGFRIGGFAYLTDCSGIPAASLPLLADLDVLVLDGLRDRPHPTHFSIHEALCAVSAISPRKAYLTHLCHAHSHAEYSRLCRGYALELGMEADRAEPAYDGLEIGGIPELWAGARGPGPGRD